MSDVHPAWVEHQRQRWLRPDWQRWMRHDAHRFALPGAMQEKSYAARRIEQRQLEEKQAHAAALEELYDDLRPLRWLVRDLKIDLAIRRLRLKYSPDQPRDELGRWTNVGAGGGSSQSTEGNEHAVVGSQTVLSDASPDPILPGAQYAQAPVEIDPSALTGRSQIDDKTRALADRLATIADSVPQGMGLLYGTIVHRLFRADLSMGSVPGIEVGDLDQTFGGTGLYGSKDSVRPDIVLRSESGDIVAIYDVKTGNAKIDAPRAEELRSKTNVGIDIPVIELHVTKGVSIKGFIGYPQ